MVNAREYLEDTWHKFTGLSLLRKAFLICGLSIIVICLRRPELLLHPQFWAEDFAVFYRDAYIQGISSLAHSYSDFLQTYPRLVALIAVKFPISIGPLIFNLVSVSIMILPIFVLWSDKTLLEKEGDFKKLILTVLLLLMPNVTEVFGNLTNSIWYLAIASILVLTRLNPSSAKRWLVFDSIILLLMGMTGPFSSVLLLTAFFLVVHRRARLPETYIKFTILLVCALVQIFVYTHHSHQSSSVIHQSRSIVSNYNRPVEITGMRFFVLPVLGERIVTNESVASSPQMYALGIVFILLALIAFAKTRLEIRTIIFFCAVLYVTSFLRAQTVPIVQFWKMLQFNAFGERYFLVPFFGWLVALLALTNYRKDFTAKLAASLLVMYLVFFPFAFSVPRLKDTNFAVQAKKFESLNTGSTGCFAINPDAAWTTCLKKK